MAHKQEAYKRDEINMAGSSLEREKVKFDQIIRNLVKSAEYDPNLQFISEMKSISPNSRVYVVGGAVRDALMGHEPHDFDLLVEGFKPSEIEDFFSKNGFLIQQNGQKVGTYKFLPSGQNIPIDIALPRVENYESLSRIPTVQTENVSVIDDLDRRDFTINAMAVEIFSNNNELVFIDPADGASDIRNKIIRSVGNPHERFNEDPLRILRAVRFVCKFEDFQIEENLFKTMKDLGHTIDQTYLHSSDNEKRRVAYERIQKEISAGFAANASKYLEILDQTDLLKIVFPEIENLKGVRQPDDYHSEGDVFTHTMLVMKNIPNDASLVLKLAGLFHDAGKADTYNEMPDGKITFHGHEKLSAEIARKALNRLKFSNKIIDDVAWLVGDHMKINLFKQMKSSNQKRMVSNPLFADLLALARADNRSSIKSDGSVEDETFYDEVMQTAIDILEKANGPVYVEIIDGLDIINEFKRLNINDPMRTHGKQIGIIKRQINDAFNDGYIESKEEAVSLIEKLIKNIH